MLVVLLLENLSLTVGLFVKLGFVGSVILHRRIPRVNDAISDVGTIERQSCGQYVGIYFNEIRLIGNGGNVDRLLSIHTETDGSTHIILPVSQLGGKVGPRQITQRNPTIAPIKVNVDNIIDVDTLWESIKRDDFTVTHILQLGRAVCKWGGRGERTRPRWIGWSRAARCPALGVDVVKDVGKDVLTSRDCGVASPCCG